MEGLLMSVCVTYRKGSDAGYVVIAHQNGNLLYDVRIFTDTQEGARSVAEVLSMYATRVDFKEHG